MDTIRTTNNPDLPTRNSVDKELGKTRDEVSGEDQGMEEHQVIFHGFTWQHSGWE